MSYRLYILITIFTFLGELTLECIIESEPAPTVAWYKVKKQYYSERKGLLIYEPNNIEYFITQ